VTGQPVRTPNLVAIMKMQRIRSHSGITLIELMITVVIVGIVSAMAVPRFQVATDRIRFGSASRDVVSSIRLARSMALADKEPYGIQVNEGDRTIVLFKDVSDPALLTYAAGADSLIRVDTLPSEFAYIASDCANNTIVFGRSGTAEFTGGGNIWAMASSSHVLGIYTFNVLSATGRVKLESYYY